MDFIGCHDRVIAQTGSQPAELVHRHPGAMGATATGCSIASSRRFNEAFAWIALAQFVKQTAIGCDDEGLMR